VHASTVDAPRYDDSYKIEITQRKGGDEWLMKEVLTVD
jgi:hypothetical protein